MRLNGRLLVAAGCACLGTLVEPARARAEGKHCAADGECPGKEICLEGACALPRVGADAAPQTARGQVPVDEHSPEETRCESDADCGSDVCDLTLLHVHGEEYRVCREAPAAAGEPSVLLGLYYLSGIGLYGGVKNPVPASSVGLDLATHGLVRYHLSIGYTHLNGFHGLLFAPIDWGFAIPLSKGKVDVYLEPLLEPWKLELYVAGKFLSFNVSSAVDLAAVVEYGPMYFSLSPVGAEVRYLTLDGRMGEGDIAGGIGIDWRVRAAVGLRL